jgi:hypothetical protein
MRLIFIKRIKYFALIHEAISVYRIVYYNLSPGVMPFPPDCVQDLMAGRA